MLFAQLTYKLRELQNEERHTRVRAEKAERDVEVLRILVKNLNTSATRLETAVERARDARRNEERRAGEARAARAGLEVMVDELTERNVHLKRKAGALATRLSREKVKAAAAAAADADAKPECEGKCESHANVGVCVSEFVHLFHLYSVLSTEWGLLMLVCCWQM